MFWRDAPSHILPPPLPWVIAFIYPTPLIPFQIGTCTSIVIYISVLVSVLILVLVYYNPVANIVLYGIPKLFLIVSGACVKWMEGESAPLYPLSL